MSELTLKAEPKAKHYSSQVFRRLLKNPTAVVGMVVLAILILVAILAPTISPYSYDEMDFSHINSAPSSLHIMGTDSLGRDIFSRLLYGSRYSLSLGLLSSLFSTAVAIVLGSLAGYYGGTVDNIIMRLCDVIQAVPATLLTIIISVALGTGYVNTILALAIGGIAGGVRLIRGQILSVRRDEYIEAAQTINLSNARIMFRHILPNVISPLIVSTTMGIGQCIILAASLSVIGLGVQPPEPEWGAMLAEGRNYIMNYPWRTIFPGLFIFITVLSVNLFGDGLRDALDPKLKK